MINESEFTSNTASDGLIIWYWSHFVQLGSDLSLNLGPKLSAKLTFETSKQTSNKPPNKLGLSWAKLSSNWNWKWILLYSRFATLNQLKHDMNLTGTNNLLLLNMNSQHKQLTSTNRAIPRYQLSSTTQSHFQPLKTPPLVMLLSSTIYIYGTFNTNPIGEL